MTRKFFSIVCAAIISISAFAQSATSTTVPEQVQQGFRSLYPNVSNVTWGEESGYYLPKFTVNGKNTVGYIDLKGHFIQTIEKLTPAGLPPAAASYISQNYSGAQIAEAGRIDFPAGNKSRFYAKVNDKELLFDINGSFIKETASPLKQ